MSYKINKKKFSEFVDYGLKTGFDNEDSVINHIEYLVDLFNDLSDPIILYRLIFLGKKSDLKKEKPGSHYVLDKRKLLTNHYDEMLYDYSEFEDSKPYILTIETPKNRIDFDLTISNNLAYPHEEEITLKDKGEGVKIISLELFKN